MPHVLYDSRRPLTTCEFANLSRQVGVLVHTPFHHAGLNREMVDVSYEIPTHNTRTFGHCYALAEWPKKAKENTARIVAEIDRQIAELTAHRERLAAELTKPIGTSSHYAP
jgi:hypothetical protein